MPHLDPTSKVYAARYYRLLDVLKTEGLVEPRYDANSPGEWLAWAHGCFLFESRSRAILLANNTLPAPRSFPEIDELMRYLDKVFHRDGNQGDILGLGLSYDRLVRDLGAARTDQPGRASSSREPTLPDNLESMGRAIHNIAVDQRRMHGTLVGLLEIRLFIGVGVVVMGVGVKGIDMRVAEAVTS
ncbi:hypothetical protein DAEQUDRAFT_768670 [Daedalea quercina L-15889]|uniref:Uncharacterized protein n=1 Tax=Daedalea quercina L-15889 TaxID=1314783 RepID=A0A165MFA8_9APHY|nr:hypothetical protein DAEQUDRAFT_768670 [Daedalea quercina L-15889]